MKKCFLTLLICIFVLSSCTFNEESYTLNEELYGNRIGRDYCGHVGDGKFFMMRFADVKELLIAEDPHNYNVILTHEYRHKFDGDDLYYYSADGFAVVYAKSNLCKVLITDFPEELVDEFEISVGVRSKENNYRISELVGEEYKCIIYLDSFDEFTEYEQKMLEDLKNEQDNEDKLKDFLNGGWNSIFQYFDS